MRIGLGGGQQPRQPRLQKLEPLETLGFFRQKVERSCVKKEKMYIYIYFCYYLNVSFELCFSAEEKTDFTSCLAVS